MKRRDEIYAEIYKAIQEEVGFGISEKKAAKFGSTLTIEGIQQDGMK